MISHQSQIVEELVGNVKLGVKQLDKEYQAVIAHCGGKTYLIQRHRASLCSQQGLECPDPIRLAQGHRLTARYHTPGQA